MKKKQAAKFKGKTLRVKPMSKKVDTNSIVTQMASLRHDQKTLGTHFDSLQTRIQKLEQIIKGTKNEDDNNSQNCDNIPKLKV